MKRKVELLAPAGNYRAFLGAVNAGADAVYLGGEKFGARAYADNFTAEEICRALHVAHFMGRKIYLTVNTLIKETEFAELDSYLRPFYEAGLDGVIVQDIGVLCYIREHFQGLSLHASTQMALTGAGGAAFLKEQGVERVVPARELSLEEVRRMKEETGLEIECFIHGAMCYSYSGQCLFSSILGGRSGNRGRCAQPCRLPYQICEGAERTAGVEYPLSLKDMCTVAYIPQLLEAGIDSFKIEGRMKKPEYAAGVTAVYRKYIDLYEREGIPGYHVEGEDLDKLRSLYIRSEIQTGYYERHNGREMITLHRPSYATGDKALLSELEALYLREPDKHPVRMRLTLKAGEPACLQISGMYDGNRDVRNTDTTSDAKETGREVTVTVYGDAVEVAQKMPLTRETIEKQLLKTGNSCVAVSACELTIDGDVFLPVRALNELRRKGVEEYERQYTAMQGMFFSREQIPGNPEVKREEESRLTESVGQNETKPGSISPSESGRVCKAASNTVIDIFVSTIEQLAEAVTHRCRRIYIDSDLYLAQHEQAFACMKAHGDPEYYLTLPYVLRAGDGAYLQRLTELVTSKRNGEAGRGHQGKGVYPVVKGFLVRNFEGAAYVKTLGASFGMVPDAGMYIFNEESARFWSDYCREYTLPYELNRKELGRLGAYTDSIGMNAVLIAYSRIPMMITANCLKKTAGSCMAQRQPAQCAQPQSGSLAGKGQRAMCLKDRYGTVFPVALNCEHCYNIIYNSVPYSLHLQENEMIKTGVGIWRYDFTIESAKECRQILEGRAFPFDAYTTGHLKRGVE